MRACVQAVIAVMRRTFSFLTCQDNDTMVLPIRRSTGNQQVTMDAPIHLEINIPEQKRSATAFPDTPHPQKTMRLEERHGDTPPTDTSGDTAENAGDNGAGYDEVSVW